MLKQWTRDIPHTLTTLAGVGCLLLLAWTNGMAEPVVPHWLQFLLLYLGIACLIWGLGTAAREATTPIRWREVSRQELLLITGILGLALVLRLWALGTKVRAPVDELLPMTEILALWNTPHLPMIRQFGLISSLTRLFASWQAGSVALFGHNLMALRIPSAIVGTLTVGATYFLGRVLFDRKTAIIGALLLATYPPHLQFSRIGIMSIADPLFGTLAFAFIVVGFRSNRRLAWVLGGVCLGLTQYFYEGGRLVYPALILIYVLVKLLFNRKRIRDWRGGLLIGAAAAVLVALPVYYTLEALQNPLSERMNILALSRNDWFVLLTSPPNSPRFDWLWRHLVDPLLLFISRPDQTPYYGGSTALILIFVLPGFLIGFIWSVRHPNGRGLVLWFLVTWAGNILLVDSALVTHYLVVFPAVVLITAVGIVQTAAYLPAPYHFKVAAVYVAVCCIGQTVYYFGPHLEGYNQQLVQGRDAYDALYRAAELPADTAVYLIEPPTSMTEDYAKPFLQFLSDDKTIHLIDTPDTFDFSSLDPASKIAFLVPADDTTTPQLLAQHFDLQAPEYTTYPLPVDKAYVIYRTIPK